MKKFKVIVECEFELSDNFEVGKEPEDGFLCLKRNGKCYEPDLRWLIRKRYFDGSSLGKYETAPGTGWESVDDDTANEFFNATVSQEYKIEELPKHV